MKINFDQKILTLEGKSIPILLGDGRKSGKDMTLLSATQEVFTQGTKDDRDMLPDEKLKRFELILRITHEVELDLDSDEISLIKKLIGNFYVSPVIVGQTLKMLEGKPTGIVPTKEEQKETEVMERNKKDFGNK